MTRPVLPNRLLEAREAIERGEPVDWKRIHALQALDLAILGREFVERAAEHHEEENEHVKRFLDTAR